MAVMHKVTITSENEKKKKMLIATNALGTGLEIPSHLILEDYYG